MNNLHRSLLVLLLSSSSLQAGDLLKNGDFSGSSIHPWKLEIRKGYGAPAKAKTVKGEGVHIQIEQAVQHTYLVLSQEVKIKEGKRYTLTFDAKTISSTPVMRANVHWKGKKTFEDGGLKSRIKISSEWATYQETFTATEKPSGYKGTLNLLIGGLDDDVWFRNVSLTPAP